MKATPLLFAALAAVSFSHRLQAEAFTWHGDLLDGGEAANGRYDLRVQAFGQPGATQALGEATELPAVAVVDGRFSVELDLPDVADGGGWVEVAVRRSGSGDAFVTLGAPLPLTKANSTCPGAWALDGNTGVPAGSFLGLADPVSATPLELRARNTRVAGFVPDGSSADHGDAPRVAFGSSANQAAARGATVAGGGATRDGSGGSCGTCRNLAGAPFASVGGGLGNSASGSGSTVAGGFGNVASGGLAAVGGGTGNVASGNDGSTVAGGEANQASGFISAVGGGSGNVAAGGYAGVLSGQNNTAQGDFAAVLGGRANCAGGRDSVALGRNAKVRPPTGASTGACAGVPDSGDPDGDEGSFVWADAQGDSLASSGQNQFLVRAGGGVILNSTFSPENADDLVIGSRAGGDADVDLRLRTRSGRDGLLFLSDTNGGFSLVASDLEPDTNFLNTSTGAFLSYGGTWTNSSSASLKQGFAAVASTDILQRLLQLPIMTWEYRASQEGRHLGPTAEDFHRLFGLAGDGRAIATVDADGVALAAIQGLNAKLERENASLRSALEDLSARLARLESGEVR